MAAYADLSYEQMEQLGSHGGFRIRGQVVQSANLQKYATTLVLTSVPAPQSAA